MQNNRLDWVSPGARFSKAPKTFRARKAKAKSRTLRLQSCFIHIFLVWREVHFIQEVSGAYTSPFLHSGERKMALRARDSRNGPLVCLERRGVKRGTRRVCRAFSFPTPHPRTASWHNLTQSRSGLRKMTYFRLSLACGDGNTSAIKAALRMDQKRKWTKTVTEFCAQQKRHSSVSKCFYLLSYKPPKTLYRVYFYNAPCNNLDFNWSRTANCLSTLVTFFDVIVFTSGQTFEETFG